MHPSLPSDAPLSAKARLRAWAGSLKLRLALASASLIALTVIAVSALMLDGSARQTERAVLDNELAEADQLAVLLRDRIVRLQLALRAAAQPVDARVLHERDAQQAYMRQRQVLATLFSTLALATTDGRVLVLREGDTVTHPSLLIGDRTYFRSTLAQGRAQVSEPVVSRLNRGPVVVLTMPVFSARGEVQAVLLGSMRLATNELLSGLAGHAETGNSVTTTVLSDSTGLVIWHPDPAWVLRPVEAVPGLAEVAAEWVRSGRPIEPQADARRVSGHLVAQAGVPGPDWVVYRVTPTDRLFSGLARMADELLLWGAVITLLATLLLWLWLARLLDPLDRLEQRARALGPEGLPLEAGWPDAHGEIGELERALRGALRRQARAETEQAASLGKLRSVMSTAPVGLAFTRGRVFELLSDEFCRLFAYPANGLVGMPARIIYASELDYEALGPRVTSAFAAGDPFVGDFEFVRRDGSRFIGELRGRPVDGDDRDAGTIWLLRDVTAERELHRELDWSAHHDALTGLMNRRRFERSLQQLLGRLGELRRAALLFIDLDRFKQVNDSAGHAAGDEVLREVARALTGHLRRDEAVARIGGDEFAVLLEGCDGEAAERIAHKLRQAIEQVQVNWGSQSLGVGASVGVLALEPGMHDAEALMHQVDQACYAAKQAGRNTVRRVGTDDPLPQV